MKVVINNNWGGFRLSPVKDQSGVNPKAVLRITFDESVLAKTGTISIYQNKTLYETISIPNANVSIANNVVSIVHTKPFSINARIGVPSPWAASGIRPITFVP